MSDDLCGAGVRVPYAELHVHSNFSFLHGVSHPEALVEEAARAGLDAIALTDHDGVYGVVRFAEAARETRRADGTVTDPATAASSTPTSLTTSSPSPPKPCSERVSQGGRE